MTKFIFTFLCSIIFSSLSYAFQASPFENPKNLKVLPKDISTNDLRKNMREFSLALGVRCTHCHVMEVPEGAERGTIKYDLDDKENKRIAREMMKLVSTINLTVGKLDRGSEHKFAKVTCTTCHRGQNRPLLIHNVLDLALEKGGADEVIKEYSELRDQYYGRHTFDFGPVVLADFARKVAEGDDLEGGVKLAKFNTSLNRENAYSFQILGHIHMAMEEFEEALQVYKKALDLDPRPYTEGLVKRAKDAIENQK